MHPSLRSPYRALIRQLFKSSKSTPANPRQTIAHIRSICDDSTQHQHQSIIINLNHAAAFLRAQRLHTALLEKYNPTINFTSEKRIQATAKRVGLQVTL